MRVLVFLLLLIVNFSYLHAQDSASKDTLKAERFIEEDLNLPSELLLIEDWLFVKDLREQTGEYGIKVFDINTAKKIYEFIRSGRGPGEYLNFDMRKGPRKYLLEISGSTTRKNDIYDVKCLQKRPDQNKTYKCITKTVPNMSSREAIVLKDSLVLNHATSPDKQGVLFISKGNNAIKTIDSIPPELIKDYKQHIAPLTLNGYLFANSDRSIFGYFGSHYDHYSFYSISFNPLSVKKLKAKNFTYLPEFEVLDYGQSYALLPTDDTKFAFREPTVGDSHIFVPYSGKTNADLDIVAEDIEWRAFTNTIFVYDWEGNKIKQIRLNKAVSKITVNDDETILFGVHFDKNLQSSIIKVNLEENL